MHTFGLGTYRLDETEHKGATTTGRASAGVFDRHLIGHALADKRAVKGVEHAGLDVIEGSRVAVAGAPQLSGDLLKDAAGTRSHHHDAIGECDSLVDVMSNQDHHRPRVIGACACRRRRLSDCRRTAWPAASLRGDFTPRLSCIC